MSRTAVHAQCEGGATLAVTLVVYAWAFTPCVSRSRWWGFWAFTLTRVPSGTPSKTATDLAAGGAESRRSGATLGPKENTVSRSPSFREVLLRLFVLIREFLSSPDLKHHLERPN